MEDQVQILKDWIAKEGRKPTWVAQQVGYSPHLRSSVFQILAQAGYVGNTRTLRLHSVHIASQMLDYLTDRHEHYVLRCIQVGP